MNCIDCSYSLLKDGQSKCTYEEGECIKISLLEKENAELKEDLRNKKLAIQNRNGRIKELEEENAELKEKYLKPNYDIKGFTGIEVNGVRFSNIGEMLCYMNKQREQLTKAKAIIRDLLRVTYDEGWNYSLGVKAMAEQFLKEV